MTNLKLALTLTDRGHRELDAFRVKRNKDQSTKARDAGSGSKAHPTLAHSTNKIVSN